ncbi:hypothetical protein Tcan_09670 [Toxocara canis]|uniref:Uncharacterized protein n=1 Tax=Toxocara canis TaxID=6265 RepID=A0A0B2UZ60_TOXCA|nr:hypothetical protein Tcan_09670 [Toxocara canis]
MWPTLVFLLVLAIASSIHAANQHGMVKRQGYDGHKDNTPVKEFVVSANVDKLNDAKSDRLSMLTTPIDSALPSDHSGKAIERAENNNKHIVRKIRQAAPAGGDGQQEDEAKNSNSVSNNSGSTANANHSETTTITVTTPVSDATNLNKPFSQTTHITETPELLNQTIHTDGTPEPSNHMIYTDRNLEHLNKMNHVDEVPELFGVMDHTTRTPEPLNQTSYTHAESEISPNGCALDSFY